uniref:Uncharacterized protein n=1 Tax=Arundo donax TaxID=35708 RepID=A0A0A9E425_ARUDO
MCDEIIIYHFQFFLSHLTYCISDYLNRLDVSDGKDVCLDEHCCR